MAHKHSGGWAFPTAKEMGSGGMTLRDYFASQALQSLISGWPAPSQHDAPTWSEADMQLVTTQAYAFADSMLAARRASQDPPEDIAANAAIKFPARVENQDPIPGDVR